MERLNSDSADAPPMSPTKVAQAEAVKKQGDLVRKLKEEKADKAKVRPINLYIVIFLGTYRLFDARACEVMGKNYKQ